jgi:hypothetical protein
MSEEYRGVMLIKEGVANCALVREELKTYDVEWNWKVA